jgi:hypothetical protein
MRNKVLKIAIRNNKFLLKCKMSNFNILKKESFSWIILKDSLQVIDNLKTNTDRLFLGYSKYLNKYKEII